VKLTFSIIVPVYNRPEEVDELLDSLCNQTYGDPFEVIIVEDGSEYDCKDVVDRYRDILDIKYFTKENSGPGLTRNYGMERAKGNYFIVFDSDCIIPDEYLQAVDDGLHKRFTDIFGGPDAADDQFTIIQKAINYSMTSFLTTGGIRGKENSVEAFQPRSFNLGMSKKAFDMTGGFGEMRVGEDIDFSLRSKELGLKSQLITEAYVYHKRRTNLYDFYCQTFSFGKARPFLNRKFKGTAKLTYWFPSFFIVGYGLSFILYFLDFPWLLYGMFLYLGLIFLGSTLQNKSLVVGMTSIITTIIQFFGYGLGFLQGTFSRK